VSRSFVSGLIQSAAGSLNGSSVASLRHLAFGSYAYSSRNPLTVQEERRGDSGLYLSRLSFQKRTGERFAGLFVRPRAEGVYPCALLLHALSSDKETMIQHFGRALADRGYAALALDANLHGERRRGCNYDALSPWQYLELLRESIIEYRQAMDYLALREDVDAQRTGLLGYSLGAMMGSVLAGVDARVKACVFMVGGDMVREHLGRVPAVLRGVLNNVSPANFVQKIAPRPVFFINGTQDTVVPRSAAEAFHAAARDPKEVLWTDAGHILPPVAALQGVEWLSGRFGEMRTAPAVAKRGYGLAMEHARC